MPRSGRPPASRDTERRRVHELSDAGLSSRRVAAAVYGDPRLKDRVLRLRRRRRKHTIRGVDLETATAQELDQLTARTLDELLNAEGMPEQARLPPA